MKASWKRKGAVNRIRPFFRMVRFSFIERRNSFIPAGCVRPERRWICRRKHGRSFRDVRGDRVHGVAAVAVERETQPLQGIGAVRSRRLETAATRPSRPRVPGHRSILAMAHRLQNTLAKHGPVVNATALSPATGVRLRARVSPQRVGLDSSWGGGLEPWATQALREGRWD